MAATISLAILGLLLSVGLAIASKYLAVKTDPRVEQILEALPGANCGGCGSGGCAAYAKGVIEQGLDFTLCSPGGQSAISKIAKILGKEEVQVEPKTAMILCAGDNNHAQKKYNYVGIDDCRSAVNFAEADKLCAYGCIGLGTCVNMCEFDAIHITDSGIAIVDMNKCTACGKCVKACPRNIIKMVPKASPVHVLCSNPLKGKIVKQQCDVGCIGCKLCNKKSDLIEMKEDLAVVNYEKTEKLLLEKKDEERKLNKELLAETALVCPSECIIDIRKYNINEWINSKEVKNDFQKRVEIYKEEEKKKKAKKSQEQQSVETTN